MPIPLSQSGFDVARKNMILGQLIPNRIQKTELLEAIDSIRREKFLPERLQSKAYADESVLIKGQTILFAPLIFANLMLLADIRPTDFVLNLKAGTGYSAAVMAKLTTAVVGLESDEGLCEAAQQIFVDMEIDNAAILTQGSELGFPSQAPYDIIFVDGVIPQISEEIFSQLSDGGRLVAVVANPSDNFGRAVKVIKSNDFISYVSGFDIDLSFFSRAPDYKNFIFDEVS